ncbi:phosphodiester glycosidase family protein [Clostridium estertheticum]|uniref:phosphodiester glycosidase family protein n=1 Tax=Clostridium estertheticum TaxID=238834 RepID=UPI001CF185F2|nr:phosphodiester glycosidase family protein [Clostridium estertheticum]MCB2308534.1 phosphodiester glycosidase family protein [Clostridium estertheticum]MCB2346942.1 phosphodiester glycosidase family protein [Clostridium estertheticum]MCB2351510.1 phosphodiester glycosidase family protein [Clostridium estertheticum]WAG46592.1 phosphodiester glycosidase family protein [Clostridium estertheticum]
MKTINKKEKGKMSKGRLVLLFIIFQIVFTTITGPFMIYYGPFKNVRSTVVGSAMTTYTLQWLVTSFLSDDKINKIMRQQKADIIVQDNSHGIGTGVKVKNKNDKSVTRYEIVGTKFKGYLLVINDPTRVKVGYSSMIGKEGELTSDIARSNNAIAAINGGGFTDKSVGSLWTGTGANPAGIIMSGGKIIYNDINNDNEKIEIIALTKLGKLLVGTYTIKEMMKFGVSDAVSFGPAMIVNGLKTINHGNGGWGIAPRTCIAQRKDGTILFLVIDGRQMHSLGATLREAQDVLYDHGAYNAANLDGGSSSTLFYDDEVINNPCDSLGERSVPSIIYVENRK